MRLTQQRVHESLLVGWWRLGGKWRENSGQVFVPKIAGTTRRPGRAQGKSGNVSRVVATTADAFQQLCFHSSIGFVRFRCFAAIVWTKRLIE